MLNQRQFRITWYEKVRFGQAYIRNLVVKVSRTDDFAQDAHNALQTALKVTGSLKKVEIVEIQEINMETGEPIGEPIKPTDDVNIVPYKKG